MKFTSFLFIVYSLVPAAVASEPMAAVDALQRFRECFNGRDTSAFDAWLITQDRYDQVLAGLTERNVTCLNNFDRTYSTRQALLDFQENIAAAGEYVLDSIAPLRDGKLTGCGGITYRKLDARAYFRKPGENVSLLELPLSLVLIDLGAGEQRLMMPILNLKNLAHAPQ